MRHPGRESLLWPGACAAMDALGAPPPPPPPAGATWVDVADRGADTFEFLRSTSTTTAAAT